MKKLVIIVLAILLSHLVNAQDVITKRNGDEINANILEVNKTEIKYKRFDNLEGPTFTIDASEIFMIKYANGTKDVLNPDNTMQQNNDPNAKQAELSNNQNVNALQEKMNDGNRDGGMDVTSQTAPPALPVYAQPACPVEGHLWTPGYWAFSIFRGFFWVPGVWVAAPEPGLLWTPGYWGYVNGNYRWNEGYWGPHVGYYGGISYGYGYTGSGYYGGRWEGHSFQYNTAVCNVNATVVHNTYIDNTVVNNTSRNTYAYNGPGGSIAQPTENERIAMNENHVRPASDQISHRQMASKDENQYYTVNRGHPATTTMNKINGQRYGVEASQPRANTETNHIQNNNSSQQHNNIPQKNANTSVNKGNNSEQHSNILQQKNNASQKTGNNTQPRNNVPEQKSGTFENRSNNNQLHTNAPQQKTLAPQKTTKQQPSKTKQNKPKPQQKNNASQQKKNAPENKTLPK